MSLLTPIIKRLTANAINDLTGFYAGKPGAQVGAAGIGFAKTIANTVEQELSPFATKLFEDEGISRTLQKVLKKNLKFLDSKSVTSVVDKEMQIRLNKTKVTKLKRKIKSGKDRELLKLYNSELIRAKKIARIKLTDGDKSLLKDSIKASKAIEGQLGYNYLQSNQQKIASRVLNDIFEAENYHGRGDFNLDSFTKIKDYNKPWMNEGVLGEKQMSTFYDNIKKAQGLGDEPVDMFVKKSNVSKGSGDIIHNINYKAPNSKKVTKIIKKNGKAFDSLDSLTVKLKKAGISFEKKDDVLYFQDNFKSSAYELGGVNAQHSVDKNGNMVTIVNDVNDMFGIKMPAGNNGLSIVPPYIRNPLMGSVKKQPQTPVMRQDKEEKIIRSKALAERIGVGERRNTGQQALTQNQRYTADQIANMKPDNLTMKEWLAYLAKMGIVVGGPAYGLMSGEGQQQ